MKSWKDISVRKYLQIQDILKQELDDETKLIQLANAIYDEDITELTIPEYKKRIEDMSFIKEKPETEKLARNYTINGTKYVNKSDVGSVQANQFIDFQNYTKNEDLVGCISCFFVPDGHKYNDGYDMLKAKNDIGELPITVANGLAFFFKTQYVVLLVLSQRYSLKRMKELGMNNKKLKEMQDSLTTLGIANLASVLSY